MIRLIDIQENKLVFEPLKKLNLQIGKVYELKEYKKSRSKDANAMMWAILQQISEVTGEDTWNLYLMQLEKAGVSVEYLEAPHAAENTLKKLFRIVYKVENRISAKGKPTALFKVYLGSSHFDTKEMSILLNQVIELAESLGIEVNK